MYEDRRQYVRQKLDSQVRYGLVGGKEYRDGRLVDISSGGVRLEAPALLRTGSVIQVQVQNQDQDGDTLAVSRSFHARVRWSKDLGDQERTRYDLGMEYA